MNPKKIQVKLFTQLDVDLEEIVPIFHRWIQDNLLDGLMLDVADYRHVPNGPGVLLIGHEGDYALDLTGDRPGLIYKHKRDWPVHVESLADKLTFVLAKAKTAAELLTAQSDLTFDPTEIELRFPDRLSTPNTVDTFADILADLANHTETVFGNSEVEFSYLSADPRQALTLSVQNLPVAEAV